MHTFWLKRHANTDVWRNPVRGFAGAYYIWLDAQRREEFNDSGIHSMKYAEVINASSALE